jgi:hypothetical protein
MRPLRFTDAERADPFLAQAIVEHDAAKIQLAALFNSLAIDYPNVSKEDVDAWSTAYEDCRKRLLAARRVVMGKQRARSLAR